MRDYEKDKPWTVKWSIFLKESVFNSLFLWNIYLFPLLNGSCLFFKVKVQNAWAHFTLSWVKDDSCKGKRPEGTSDNSDYFQRRATVATFEVNSGLCESCLSWACNIDFSTYIYNEIFLFSSGFSDKKKLNYNFYDVIILCVARLCACLLFSNCISCHFCPVTPQSLFHFRITRFLLFFCF